MSNYINESRDTDRFTTFARASILTVAFGTFFSMFAYAIYDHFSRPPVNNNRLNTSKGLDSQTIINDYDQDKDGFLNTSELYTLLNDYNLEKKS